MNKIYREMTLASILAFSIYISINYIYQNKEVQKTDVSVNMKSKECMFENKKVHITFIDEPDVIDGGNGTMYDEQGREVAKYIGFVGGWAYNDGTTSRGVSYDELKDCK